MSFFRKKTKPHVRHFFNDEELRSVRCLLSHGISIEDAPVKAKGGLLIDGHLKRCRIYRDDTPGLVRISVLGCVQSSLIECTDLLIEGMADSVVIAASGRIEISPTAVVVGRILLGTQTRLHIAPGANVVNMSVKSLQQTEHTMHQVDTTFNAKATDASYT